VELSIVDDGCPGVVVKYEGIWVRYSDSYRSLFDSDQEFLKHIYPEVMEEVEKSRGIEYIGHRPVTVRLYSLNQEGA